MTDGAAETEKAVYLDAEDRTIWLGLLQLEGDEGQHWRIARGYYGTVNWIDNFSLNGWMGMGIRGLEEAQSSPSPDRRRMAPIAPVSGQRYDPHCTLHIVQPVVHGHPTYIQVAQHNSV
jgi:hypothetical protein